MFTPQIGHFNELQILGENEFGLNLDGGEEFGSILLPKRYAPKVFETGERIRVFLYLDSDDRLIATTESPIATADEFAYLRVIDSTRSGSFLEWGLPKDLLLPFGEQPKRSRVGDHVVVYIYLDEISGRLVASAKLKKFVSEKPPPNFRAGMEVDIMPVEKTDIGIRSIVNDKYWGFLKGEIIDNNCKFGLKQKGFISRITEENFLDLSFQPPGYTKVSGAAEKLLHSLITAEGGFLAVHDKSLPEEVRKVTGMSKKVFKQAVGKLYKEKKIQISDKGIILTSQSEGGTNGV